MELDLNFLVSEIPHNAIWPVSSYFLERAAVVYMSDTGLQLETIVFKTGKKLGDRLSHYFDSYKENGTIMFR